MFSAMALVCVTVSDTYYPFMRWLSCVLVLVVQFYYLPIKLDVLRVLHQENGKNT